MVGSVTGFAALKSPAAWMLPASVLVIVLSTSLLSGCATGTASAVDASARQAEPMTAFDEPEVRRRARIRLQLAGSYFEQGQTTVALDELKQAIAIDPTFADAYNLRGLIYMRMNEPGLAEESFRRSIALNPRDASAHHNYGWMLCQQKRFPEGDKLFAQAVANPTYAEKSKTFMAQGLCQISAGQPAEAERTLVRAYELDAGNPCTVLYPETEQRRVCECRVLVAGHQGRAPVERLRRHVAAGKPATPPFPSVQRARSVRAGCI